MCEYDYNDRVAACNETRIYPSGCCPNDECECRKDDCHRHGKHKHDKCCKPTTVTGDDGVNRVDFCPPCADKCK